MPRQVTGRIPVSMSLVLSAVFVAGCAQWAQAATLCVDQGGGSGCQTTIGAAVAAAAAGDTVQVAAGTYKEGVIITKPLLLIGAGSATTIIDATGQPNGIFIDGSAGAPDTGISGVVVSGFTVENANFQGILVENASAVTIYNNWILGNDKALDLSLQTPCPGLPAALQQGEGDDCGEGLHFTGVHHSVVANNVVQKNSGGILITDDTGVSHDNVITGNLVSNNPYDCGITMASHSGMGVYHNTVAGNQSSGNGVSAPGAGAGVGIFAPAPGTKAYGNVVINNQLTGNGLPGVTMHNHAYNPAALPVNFDDNIIIGNTISGNAADTDDAATAGPTGINIFSLAPINGTIVAQNVISQESIGLAFKGPGRVTAYLNNFMVATGVSNMGTGTVTAAQNWWNCTTGPVLSGCAGANGAVSFDGWLTSPFAATTLPSGPTTSTNPAGGGSGINLIITGPGATGTGNTFQTLVAQVALDASQSTSSNPGGLSFAWTEAPGSPPAAIARANTATPYLQLTSRGTYQFILTLTDATGASLTASITVKY